MSPLVCHCTNYNLNFTVCKLENKTGQRYLKQASVKVVEILDYMQKVLFCLSRNKVRQTFLDFNQLQGDSHEQHVACGKTKVLIEVLKRWMK